MGLYRISRNLEASFIDFLKSKLTEDWNINRVEKTFAKIYDIEVPSICIRVGDTTHSKVEIGGNATIRNVPVLVDIFATSDGQRLDLKDYIVGIIKNGLDYYEYEIENGVIKTKTVNGRIRVLEISETLIDFDTNKSELEAHDRFRYLLTFTISLGRVEL